MGAIFGCESNKKLLFWALIPLRIGFMLIALVSNRFMLTCSICGCIFGVLYHQTVLRLIYGLIMVPAALHIVSQKRHCCFAKQRIEKCQIERFCFEKLCICVFVVIKTTAIIITNRTYNQSTP